jgi:DNA-binding winged helix-turn-helix (wHTH) protein
VASRERFGAFEVDRDAGELRKHGIKIKLADQPFSVLTSLLDRPGEVVTRDELQRKLWATDTFVDFDRGLNKAMNRLREALGDSAASPQFIETIPKRGYRFIGSLAETPDATSTPGVSQTLAEGEPLAAHLDRPPAGRTSRAWIYVAASVAVIGIALIGILKRGGGRTEPLLRSSLLPPPNTTFVPYNFVLSPDGNQLAFVAAGQGKTQLWIRALSAAEARPLIATEGATFPFWAPDNRRLGFFSDRKLKTIDEATGVVHTLADARTPSGASWGSDGTIVFAPVVNGRLYKVHENGGAVEPVTDVRGTSIVHRWPYFLPDGKRFLYVAENL